MGARNTRILDEKKQSLALFFLYRVPKGSKARFSLAPWVLSPEPLVDLQAIFYHALLQMLSPFGLSLRFLSRLFRLEDRRIPNQ